MSIKQLVVCQLTSFRFIPQPVTPLAVCCLTSESQMLNKIPTSFFLTLIFLSVISNGKYKSQLIAICFESERKTARCQVGFMK